ncbi:helix-turn-helix domain-containing protein [Sporofaciens sp. SGI.106]|uniref:helix-turn-helix domain-containing protein n=1 Tax=Sporofaciens sp. SGI.106 TaxID=3420568 RepID=UPI002A9AB1ED|nr:AraC family transcriptional regulator [Lachnoclostridium sp.]
MIFNSDCQPTPDNRELLPNKKNSYPYVCQFSDMKQYMNQSIPWHWHPALEIDYVVEGEVEIRTYDSMITLKKGQAVFINSESLHTLQAKKGECKIFAHIFDTTFISGFPGSLLEHKYILPITQNDRLQIYQITPDTYQRIQMLEKVIKIIKLNEDEPSGYEFLIRAELSLFWNMFFEETKHLQKAPKQKENSDIDRMKLMIQYIQTHYMEKITLEDIASSANIGTRECTRCFQRNLGTSPMKFLTEHRVSIATQKLLQSNDSILYISEDCGFNSGSYFGKVFYDIMGCTPKEYRKKHSH